MRDDVGFIGLLFIIAAWALGLAAGLCAPDTIQGPHLPDGAYQLAP